EINLGNQDFFFSVRCASDDFPEGIGNERAPPESKIALAANAIYGNYKDAIQRRMGAHSVCPAARRERLIALQLFEPADRSRITEDLRTLNSIHTRGFRIPLVVTNQRSDHSLACIHLYVAEIAGREVILLVIIRIVGDVHLAVLSRKLSAGIVH